MYISLLIFTAAQPLKAALHLYKDRFFRVSPKFTQGAGLQL